MVSSPTLPLPSSASMRDSAKVDLVFDNEPVPAGHGALGPRLRELGYSEQGDFDEKFHKS